MPMLIVKSPYIKGTSRKRASGYLKYIATRENVELLPAAVAQEQPDGYLNYIANRLRSHGLFGDGDTVNLAEAMAEIETYTGNVWTHILSLRREDAARLGYDNAKAWRSLLKAHRNDIAAAMKIPPNSFRWYAAFHNEDEHPHVHMMAWSANSKQGYLSTDGIQEIKSKLTNSIFKHEMLHLYEQKGISRDELVRKARRAMAELIESMGQGVCDCPEVERLMAELARRLDTVIGKKQYGYLPKGVKRLVDEVIDQMEQLPLVAECYARWQKLQAQVQSYYSGAEPEKLPLSRQKEFRAIKNAVIHEAERIRLGAFTFEEPPDEPEHEPETVYAIAQRYRQTKALLFGSWAANEDELRFAASEMRLLAEGGYPYAQYQLGYETYSKPSIRESTADYYRNYIENHIIPNIGGIKLDKLTSLDIQRMYNKTKTSGRVPRHKNIIDFSLSNRAVRGVHMLLHQALEQAVKERLIPINPTGGCKIPPKERVEMKVIPPEKVGTYLKEAEDWGVLPMFFLKKAGIEHIRFHDLRHTFATLALQNGVDIKTLSNMLGHYSAGFTLDTYTHVTNKMQQEAAEKMGGFMEQVM